MRSSDRDRLRILDLGCGNMDASTRIADQLNTTGCLKQGASLSVHGWDVSSEAVADAQAKGRDARIKDITDPSLDDVDVDRYDIVLFLEVLEHVVDTDQAMRNIHRMLKPDGILILSTPNLASWYNRVFLLVGNQPHCTEVSFAPVRFGNRIVGKILGETEGDITAAGHLRVFTWKALKEFVTYHRFQICRAVGVSNHARDLISRVISKIWIGGSGNIALAARKIVQ